MEITCRVYKPRRPRESPLFRLVEQHLEELLRVWPTRFVRPHGPLRSAPVSSFRLPPQETSFSGTLTTDRGFAPDGRFLPLAEWDATLLAGLFRERILARLLDRHAISPELVQKLLGWRHPGFSAHVGESIASQERQRLEDTAAYLVRNPLSLRKLVYLDGQQTAPA